MYQHTVLQLSISFINVVQSLEQPMKNLLPHYSNLPPLVQHLSPSLWQFRIEEVVVANKIGVYPVQILNGLQNLLFGSQAQLETLQNKMFHLELFYESESRRFISCDFSWNSN